MIVITGATGFVGSALRDALSGSGVRVTCLSRHDVELCDRGAVRRIFEKLRPSAVVHLAASLDKRENEEGRARQWRDTFEAGVVVVEEACAAGVRHLVMAGSMEELGPACGVLERDIPPAPLSTYGLCKHLLREVAALGARRDGVCVDWVRPIVVYGPGQTGDMLLPYAFHAARHQIVGEFSDGMQERDLLYIDDLVAWYRGVLSATLAPSALRVHHLGRGEGVRIRDVVEAIGHEFAPARQLFDRRPRRVGDPDRQCAPAHTRDRTCVADWTPAVSWQEGVRRTAQWWRQRPQEEDRSRGDRG